MMGTEIDPLVELAALLVHTECAQVDNETVSQQQGVGVVAVSPTRS
jgi:hypothetical protein